MKNKIIPSHYFTVKEQSLVSLVCQGKSQFIIPYNQRPWSWKDGQIDDLWNDILKTTNHFYDFSGQSATWEERVKPIGDAHFLGAFVFEEKGNDYSVVDGQQRLTSITMIVAALRNSAIALKNSNRGALRKAVNHYLDNFRAWLVADFSDDLLATRLKVDGNYDEFFTGYIVDADSEDERCAFLKEAEIDFTQEPVLTSFKKSFDYVTKLISVYLSSFDTDEARYKAIKAIFSTIENGFICIAADVKKESFSYEVFKCLNAKGLPLSQADRLKNELFTQSEIQEHEEIKKHWDVIQENTPYSAVSQFIRLRHVAVIGECPDSKLHSVITDKELVGKSVPRVVAEWADDSKDYSFITLHQTPPPSKQFTAEELEYLNDLATLKITLSSILTFTAYKLYFKESRDKFVEVLRLTRNFCFRVLTVCKKDTGYLELHLGRAARSITSGQTLKEVRSALKRASPDNEFEDAFQRFSSNTAKQQFFILNAIENFSLAESGLKTKPHGQDLNVEHILPKKFDLKDSSRSAEWSWAKADLESHKSSLNRLGNLCLLEGEINRDVSSFDYDAKLEGKYPPKYSIRRGGKERKSYKDSSLPGIRELIDKYRTWSFENINRRQVELASKAVKVWTLSASKSD